MNDTTIIAIISAIFGSSGLSAIITGWVTHRKYKIDALKAAEECSQIKSKTQLDEMKFINEKIQEISDKYKRESDELTKRNDELSKRVTELNNKLQILIEWIMYDNQQYRQWLETELMKARPDVVFPKCAPPPKIFQNNNN